MDEWYKVLGPRGEAIHGGSGKWHLPNGKRAGKWMPEIDHLRCCEAGYHLVPIDWVPEWLRPGCTIYVAEGRGAAHTDGSKTAFAQARLIRRVYLSETDMRLFAADCAEHVLHFWIEKHPDDDRPAKAIKAARAYARGEITAEVMYNAASAAASASAYAASANAASASSSAYAKERKWQGRKLLTYLKDRP